MTTYNKEKALSILDNMYELCGAEDFVEAIEDVHYTLTLGLIAYTEHLRNWDVLPAAHVEDWNTYQKALHQIHVTLQAENVFHG